MFCMVSVVVPLSREAHCIVIYFVRVCDSLISGRLRRTYCLNGQKVCRLDRVGQLK